MLDNGPIAFACLAHDVAIPANEATAKVETFLDLGPAIRILGPLNNSRHALKNPVVIRFEVLPDPVSDDDELAEVTDLTLSILGKEFQAAEDPLQAGLYAISVDFDDRELFDMPPTTAEVMITAKSSRMPDAPTRRAEVIRVESSRDGSPLCESGAHRLYRSDGSRRIPGRRGHTASLVLW
jgi:hypothetical protein